MPPAEFPLRILHLCLILAVLLVWAPRAGAQGRVKVQNDSDRVWHLTALFLPSVAFVFTWTQTSDQATIPRAEITHHFQTYPIPPGSGLSMVVIPPADHPMLAWSLDDGSLNNPRKVTIFSHGGPGEDPTAFLGRTTLNGQLPTPWPGAFDAFGTFVITEGNEAEPPRPGQASLAPLPPPRSVPAAAGAPASTADQPQAGTGPAATAAVEAVPLSPAEAGAAAASPYPTPATSEPPASPISLPALPSPRWDPVPAPVSPWGLTASLDSGDLEHPDPSLAWPASPSSSPLAAELPAGAEPAALQAQACMEVLWPSPSPSGPATSPSASGDTPPRLASPLDRHRAAAFGDGSGDRRVRPRLDIDPVAGVPAGRVPEAEGGPALVLTNGTAHLLVLTVGALDRALVVRSGHDDDDVPAGEQLGFHLPPGGLMVVRASEDSAACRMTLSPFPGGPTFRYEAAGPHPDGMPVASSLGLERVDGSLSLDLPSWLHWDCGRQLEIRDLSR